MYVCVVSVFLPEKEAFSTRTNREAFSQFLPDRGRQSRGTPFAVSPFRPPATTIAPATAGTALGDTEHSPTNITSASMYRFTPFTTPQRARSCGGLWGTVGDRTVGWITAPHPGWEENRIPETLALGGANLDSKTERWKVESVHLESVSSSGYIQ